MIEDGASDLFCLCFIIQILLVYINYIKLHTILIKSLQFSVYIGTGEKSQFKDHEFSQPQNFMKGVNKI